jgi:anti-anti-sigma factor
MSDALVVCDLAAGGVDVPPAAFACSWVGGGVDAAWVRVAGDLEVATLPQLDLVLQDAGVQARLVVLDLRELQFLDGSGAHALVSHAVCARKAGRRLVLLRGRAIVERMLMLAGCSGELEIGDADQVELAVAAFARVGEEVPVV